jgi:hypothetical protein
MNKQEFVNEFSWFLEYYDDKKMNETQLRVWFELLGQYYRRSDFHDALMSHIKTDEQPYFPALGKIYEKLPYHKIAKPAWIPN